MRHISDHPATPLPDHPLIYCAVCGEEHYPWEAEEIKRGVFICVGCLVADNLEEVEQCHCD